MKVVSVSDLKANLSRYLRRVRRGDEIQVMDRGVPVARIVGVGPGLRSDTTRRTRLVRSGVLRPGTADASPILHRPLLTLVGAKLSEALEGERGDRL